MSFRCRVHGLFLFSLVVLGLRGANPYQQQPSYGPGEQQPYGAQSWYGSQQQPYGAQSWYGFQQQPFYGSGVQQSQYGQASIPQQWAPVYQSQQIMPSQLPLPYQQRPSQRIPQVTMYQPAQVSSLIPPQQVAPMQVSPVVLIGLLKKNYFFGDLEGQMAVDELFQQSGQFQDLLFDSAKSLNLNVLVGYVKDYLAWKANEQQKELLQSQQQSEEDDYQEEPEQAIIMKDYDVEEDDLDVLVEVPAVKEHKKPYFFPATLISKGKEYPFSPFLVSNIDKGAIGLPRLTEDGSAVLGRMYYVAGREKADSKIGNWQPKWKYSPAILTRDETGDQVVKLKGGVLPDELLAMPPIFSPDAQGIARPYLFFSVMGLMEVEFARVIKKVQGFSRFPLLEAIVNNQGSSVFASLSDRVQEELTAFPLRRALLDSEFYLVRSDAKLVSKAPSKGMLDFDTYNARSLYKKYIDQGKAPEEARRLAVKRTDIRYLQAKYPGAAFQIASNIDCLEGGMEHERLENMQYGAVQGENASLGAIAATIIRKYCIERQERLLLDNTNKGFTGTEGFMSGYWKLDNAKILPGALALNQVYLAGDEMLEHVRVGVHKNVAVTSGYYDSVSSSYSKEVQKAAGLDYGDWFKENSVIKENRWHKSGGYDFYVYNGLLRGELPRVHQIFAAAYDLVHNFSFVQIVGELIGNPKLTRISREEVIQARKNYKKAVADLAKADPKKQTGYLARLKKRVELGQWLQNHENFAKKLLYAMYRGTIVAAANLQVKKLFLTCLGCGAFGNDPKWVQKILNQPEIKQLIEDSGMTVYVVAYRPPHELN